MPSHLVLRRAERGDLVGDLEVAVDVGQLVGLPDPIIFLCEPAIRISQVGPPSGGNVHVQSELNFDQQKTTSVTNTAPAGTGGKPLPQ